MCPITTNSRHRRIWFAESLKNPLTWNKFCSTYSADDQQMSKWLHSKCTFKNRCSWPLNLHDKQFLPSHKCIKPKTRKIFHQHSTFSEKGKAKGHLNLCSSLPFPNTCRLQIRAKLSWDDDWNCRRQIMAPSFKHSLWALESLPHFSGLLELLVQSQFLINFPPSLPLLCFLTPPINP